MRIHYLLNDPVAHLGNIENWVSEKSYSITVTKVYEDTKFPSVDEFDLLIILGGRMGAYEEEKYPWLALEKEFIRRVNQEKKYIVGICLGAQLIAAALGGKAYLHTNKEIGWWPVEFNKAATDVYFRGAPAVIQVFEFHEDTYDLPEGATLLASSKGCKNQAFVYDERVFGLQFHPEMTNAQIIRVVEELGDKLGSGAYIQKAEDLINQIELLEGSRKLLASLLDYIDAKINEQYGKREELSFK